VLNDDDFHQIFELLYRIVSKQRPAYIKASSGKTTTRANTSSRLETAAAALRLTVEVGVSIIKFKTALSVLDHIVDTLPLTDGSLCDPLKNDYLKSFRILLDYAPHGEHMRPKQWQAYVDFTLECLSAVLEDSTAEDSTRTSRETSITPRNDRSLSVRLSQKSSKSIGKEKATLAEEAVAALNSLTSITNARVMVRAKPIAEKIQEYLAVATTGQVEAFHALNNVIFLALAEDVSFARNLISELIPVMRRLWPWCPPLIRDQMLITLFVSRHLFLAPSGSLTPIDTAMLEPLLIALMSEYRRSEKNMLQFDEMQPLFAAEDSTLQIKQFKPLRSSGRAISCWMTLEVMASLIVGLSRNARPVSSNGDPDETPRKRRRLPDQLDEVLELAVDGFGLEKLAALQVILFVLDQPCSNERKWTQGFYKLLPDLNHEDPTIQMWVLLVYSR
jgi:serine-protein kinase ATM